MNITILGAGHGGTAMAADLTDKGHTVTLCKTSNKLNDESFEYIKKHSGRIKMHDMGLESEMNISLVTRDLSKALTKDTELVVLFIQSNYHKQLIEKIAPYLHEGQIILIEPGYLSTIYFMKTFKDIDLTIVEAESSPMDCRIETPGEITVMFRNVRNPISVFPKSRADETLKQLESLGYNFTLLDSVFEAALHNPNLIVHTIGAIMSIPRIEHSEGNYWMYKEVFTPSVWHLVKQLDQEKMNVLKSLNLRSLSYTDACRFRNSEDQTVDSEEVFINYAQNNSVKGPHVSNSRYITEDVPEGLVLLESLGNELNVVTPVCTSLINIASACLNADYRQIGRSILRYRKEYLSLLKEIV